jgi:hypothetical protein
MGVREGVAYRAKGSVSTRGSDLPALSQNSHNTLNKVETEKAWSDASGALECEVRRSILPTSGCRRNHVYGTFVRSRPKIDQVLPQNFGN